MVWELGLFGAAESSRLQAGADADLAAAREQGLRVSVVAAVVRNYLDLGVANGQIALLTQMAELDREAERLAQVRLNTRLGTPQDADTASVRRQRTLAALASMRLAADRSARALALLLGRDAPDPGWSAVAPSQGLPGFALGKCRPTCCAPVRTSARPKPKCFGPPQGWAWRARRCIRA